MAKKYKGSFTIRETSDTPRRGRRKSNPRAVVVALLILFILWFLYIRSHRAATYSPQPVNVTR